MNFFGHSEQKYCLLIAFLPEELVEEEDVEEVEDVLGWRLKEVSGSSDSTSVVGSGISKSSFLSSFTSVNIIGGDSSGVFRLSAANGVGSNCLNLELKIQSVAFDNLDIAMDWSCEGNAVSI